MSLLPSLPLAGLLLAATSSFAGASTAYPQEKPQDFVFVRPANKAIRLTVKETHDLLLESLTTQFGDQAPVAATVAMRLRTRMETALGEETLALDAMPLGYRRRYLATQGEIQVIDPASVNPVDDTWNGVELKLESPMLNSSVAFIPAASQPGGYGRHYDTRAMREVFLPKLSAPTDWSSFLPPSTEAGGPSRAALGDSWPIDIRLMESLVAPVGYMGWRTEKPEDRKKEDESKQQVLRAFSSGVGGNLQWGFQGEVTGEATARLQTVGVDPDNGRFAQIEIKFDIGLRSQRDSFDSSRRFEGDGEMEVEMLGGELEMRLKGVALINWGLDLDRPFSGLVNAEESVAMTVRVLPNAGEVVSQTISMRGALVNGLTFREMPLAPAKRVVVPVGK